MNEPDVFDTLCMYIPIGFPNISRRIDTCYKHFIRNPEFLISTFLLRGERFYRRISWSIKESTANETL